MTRIIKDPMRAFKRRLRQHFTQPVMNLLVLDIHDGETEEAIFMISLKENDTVTAASYDPDLCIEIFKNWLLDYLLAKVYNVDND